jgi:hypothetical protein
MDPTALERIVTAYGQLSVEPQHAVDVWAEAVRKTNEWRRLSDPEVGALLRELSSRDGRKHRVSVTGSRPR